MPIVPYEKQANDQVRNLRGKVFFRSFALKSSESLAIKFLYLLSERRRIRDIYFLFRLGYRCTNKKPLRDIVIGTTIFKEKCVMKNVVSTHALYQFPLLLSPSSLSTACLDTVPPQLCPSDDGKVFPLQKTRVPGNLLNPEKNTHLENGEKKRERGGLRREE